MMTMMLMPLSLHQQFTFYGVDHVPNQAQHYYLSQATEQREGDIQN